MTATKTRFVVRRHFHDRKSETIATADNYNRAYDAAMIFLMDNDRDYECFDMVEVDCKGNPVMGQDWGTVAWEPSR